ncbi:hypothetical protein P152DRAFT_373636, partial [Eremomyces bilateralis CBS 781.70]
VSISPSARSSGAKGISNVVSPSYTGFGIEPSNVFSFTGFEQPNEFSLTLMRNLANYSGAPGWLRLGGNTGDYFLYDPNFQEFRMDTNKNPTGQGNIPTDLYYIGPAYFKAIERFLEDTPITVGLNLAYNFVDWQQRITDMAQAAVDGLSNTKLVSFEIGNEPDLYGQNGFRKPSYGGPDYVQEWLDRANVVYNKVLAPGGFPKAFFEPAATASTIGTSFLIDVLVENGILQPNQSSSAVGSTDGFVSAWNQHDYFYFISVSPMELTMDYLAKFTSTETQFKHWSQEIGDTLKDHPDIPYHLREMASVGPVGQVGISDTFAATIWTLNFFLYSATLNIASVQMHMTDNSFASPWQPMSHPEKATEPHVRPSYYAFAAFTQLLGHCNGTTQIAPVSVNDAPSGYGEYLRAYGVYSANQLTAIVVLNSKLALASDPSPPSIDIQLSFPDNPGRPAYLSYLTAAGADTQSSADTNWNGFIFSDVDGTLIPADPPVGSTPNRDAVVGTDSTLSVSLRDSEAVIVS